MEWINIKETLSYRDIKKIEKKLNIHLPEDFCHKIGKINGGTLRSACYVDSKLGRIPYSRNVNLCHNARLNAIDLFYVIDDGSQKYFPFGSVGNGDYFCFALESKRIVLYVHEEGKIYDICDTYTRFIGALVE